jgi:hypothetical protein
MSHHIESVVINGTTYPYVINPATFEYTTICYDDGGTIKKIDITEVDEIIEGSE